MAVLAKNGVWLGAFLTEVDFNRIKKAFNFVKTSYVSTQRPDIYISIL